MVDIQQIRDAHARIAGHIRRTPVVRCDRIDAEFAAEIYFKCENLQEAGAFKTRGACNAVFSLSEAEASRGVATHSSGNHAAALSRAAARRGIPAYIVMPDTARAKKVEAVRHYGGQITFWPGFDVQQTIPFGTVADVRAEVRHLLDTYHRPDGRLILTMGNGVTGDTPVASLDALFDEAYAYGTQIARARSTRET